MIKRGKTIPNTYASETNIACTSVGDNVVSVIAAKRTGAQQAEVKPENNPRLKTDPILTFLVIFLLKLKKLGISNKGLIVDMPINIKIKAPK